MNDIPSIISNHLHQHFQHHTPTVTAAILHAETLQVIILATGNRLNPKANDTQIKDMHAEVLCKRALKFLLLQDQKPELDKLILYISRPPCGKAARSSLQRVKEKQDALFSQYHAFDELINDHPQYAGHAYAKLLYQSGTDDIKRKKKIHERDFIEDKKAGRADSPASNTQSCTTKVIRWVDHGIQGRKLSALVDKIPIKAIYIGEGNTAYLQNALPEISVTTFDEELTTPDTKSNSEAFIWIIGYGKEILDGKGRKRGGGVSRMCRRAITTMIDNISPSRGCQVPEFTKDAAEAPIYAASNFR